MQKWHVTIGSIKGILNYAQKRYNGYFKSQIFPQGIDA